MTGPRTLSNVTGKRLQEEQREVEALRRRIGAYVAVAGTGGRQQLAQGMGVSPAWITHLLKGRTQSVSFTTLRRAALALNLDLPDLLVETGSVSLEDLSPRTWGELRRLAKLQSALLANSNTRHLAITADGREIVEDEERRLRQMAQDIFKPPLRRSEEVLLGELRGLSAEGRGLLLQFLRAMKDSHLPVDSRDAGAPRCAECGQLFDVSGDELCARCHRALEVARRHKPTIGPGGTET